MLDKHTMLSKDEYSYRQKLLIDEYDGIFPQCEALYIRSIRYSANRSVESFRRYDASKGSEDSQAVQVGAIHEALGYAASLSRFFWLSGGGNPDYKGLVHARCEKLRDAFGLDNNSKLKNRRLRDALEHFDERLDKFLIKNGTGMFFPDAMIGDSDLADDQMGLIFKLVDPDKEVFVILGEKYPFAGIRKEVKQILSTADIFAQKGMRLKGPMHDL